MGEVASAFEYGLNAAAKEFDGAHKYLRITDIDDERRCFNENDLTSPDASAVALADAKLVPGDIVFARTGASVGKTYLYRPFDGDVYYAGFLIRAHVNECADPEFIFQSTLTERYDRYIAITSQRSGQPGVNAQEYSEFELCAPGVEEQRKIGTFFSGIDHLITLHQRELKYR